MSYSIQLYTLRNALEADLPGTLAKVAAIGFTQVEAYNFVDTAEELGAALEANGLTAPSGHAPLLSQDQEESSRRPRDWASAPSSTPMCRPRNG